MGSCILINNENVRLALGEGEARKIWKDYFEDLYNRETYERLTVHI